MGQGEVLDILENSKLPLTSREIATLLNDDEGKIIKTLNRMIKFSEVHVIELDKDLSMKFYKCKRRMRLFKA